MSWEFLDAEDVIALHEMEIRRSNSSAGVLNMPTLLSALTRPLHLVDYGDPAPDVADLAAAYLVAIAKAHAFVDGNKRAAWLAANTFLELNGYTLDRKGPTTQLGRRVARIWPRRGALSAVARSVKKHFAVALVKAVCNGLDQREVAAWIRRRMTPRGG